MGVVGVIAAVEDLNLTAHAMRAAGEFMAARDQSGDREKVQRLLEVLKEEKGKIEVFQRELPFTVQILTDVMEGFKREVERRQEEERLKEQSSAAQVMKISGEKEKSVVKLEKESLLEKTDWLSSAQLWVDNPSSSNATTSRDKSSDEGEEKRTSNTHHQPKLMPFPSHWSINGSGIMAVENHHHHHQQQQQQEQEEDHQKLNNNLTIAVSGFTRHMPPPPPSPAVSAAPVAVSTGGGSIGLQVMSQQQQNRKARRCWSPELHRVFVSALNQLGGAQVATPKQIRELMKVDGLTNDEVKSHLQKYRLHNRRVPNNITGVTVNRPMGLMDALLGTAASSSQQSVSQSASPKDMHQYFTTASGRTASTNAGDSCEDDKSESYNWK